MCGRIIYIERERERGCCSVYVCTFVPVCIHTYTKTACTFSKYCFFFVSFFLLLRVAPSSCWIRRSKDETNGLVRRLLLLLLLLRLTKRPRRRWLVRL